MPLPENVPSYLSGPEAERMITVDPVRYMANIKTLQDIPRNACLLHLLNHIQDKQWPLLRDDGILEFVAQAMQSQLAISKIDAFNAYAACLEFIRNTKIKILDAHDKALRKAFKISRSFASAAWYAVQDMPDDISADLGEAFRLAVWSVLKSLSLLRDGDGPEADDSAEEDDLANGEMLLGSSLLNNRLHELSLYCWLSAPDSETRRDSDLTRCALFEADIMDGYEYAQERFFQEVPPQKLRSQLDTIIRTRDATPKTTAFCLHFLHDFLQVHPTSGKLGDDFGGHLVDLLWIVMRSGDSEDQYFAQRNANKLLNILLKETPSPLRVLQNMIEHHDGVRLIARFTVLGAKTISAYMSGDPFFLLDQLVECFSVSVESQSPELKMLMSVARTKLEAIWPQTTTHLHGLEIAHKNDAKAVVERWNMLGNKARLSVFLNPLLGCSWYKCPLYAEKTEKKMARCVRCWKVQYCSKTCQRGDWSEGHKKVCKVVA